MVDKHVGDDQHQTQEGTEKADKGHDRQVFLQPVADIDRLVQIVPDSFQSAGGDTFGLLFHEANLLSVFFRREMNDIVR